MGLKGLNKYNGDESGNLSLGLNGFDCFTSANYDSGFVVQTGHWVAIKVLHTSSSDSLILDIKDSEGTATTGLELHSGDIIYGDFSEITDVTQDDGSSDMSGDCVIAYRG